MEGHSYLGRNFEEKKLVTLLKFFWAIFPQNFKMTGDNVVRCEPYCWLLGSGVAEA